MASRGFGRNGGGRNGGASGSGGRNGGASGSGGRNGGGNNDPVFGSFELNTENIESFARVLQDDDEGFVQNSQGFQSHQSSSEMLPPRAPPQVNVEGGDQSGQGTVSSGRRGHTSWVWPYYDKVPTNEPNKFNAICKVCRDVKKLKNLKEYKWQKSDGTGTLARHLRSEHQLGPEGEESTAGGQAQLHGYASTMPGAGMPFVYNRDRMIEELSKFVIRDEQPFSFGESSSYEEFNRVALQPAFRKVPRNTLKRHTQQAYFAYRGYLIEMFRTFEGRVSLTSDTWISSIGEPFLCITAHWIDDDWFLQKRIICFEAMEESHNGFNIKSRIITCLKNFHMLNKVFSLSLDNASANTRAIDFLKTDDDLSLLLGGELLHVRCCAHILNLCVQEGIKELQPLLEPIRTVVKWIRITRNVKRRYKQKCEQRGLKKKVWCWDTPTRWNSTFKMLTDAIKYRDVLTELYNETITNENELITNNHWTVAIVIRELLATFDSATHVFSLVYEPNIHQVILEYIKIVNSINSAGDIDSISDILARMKAKWYSYFSTFPHIYGIAAILDSGVKLDGLRSLLTFYYECLGIQYDIDAYVLKCKALLEKLHDHYASIYQPQSVGVSRATKSRWDPLVASILKKQRSSSSSSSSSSANIIGGFGSGADDYLSYQFETNDDFHILKWWRNHSTEFPILARIAKDVLAIPASTIASESAFSAGRRVLDEKRSSLSVQSIEMCVCKKDWDQAEKRTQGLKEDEEDEDDPWMILDTSDESGDGGDQN